MRRLAEHYSIGRGGGGGERDEMCTLVKKCIASLFLFILSSLIRFKIFRCSVEVDPLVVVSFDVLKRST